MFDRREHHPPSGATGDARSTRDRPVGPISDRSDDRAVVSELIDWLSSGTGVAEGRVFNLYGTSGPEFRAELLDGLARAASTECPYSLSVLLAVVGEHHLCRPAIVRTGVPASDVADVEQMALLAVSRSIHRFRGESRFTTWLHRLARNTAIGELRRRKPTVGIDGPDVRPAPGLTDRRVSSVVAESRAIETLIAQLPEAFRTTVQLRDVDHLSYQEIAERQGISINTVKSRLNRGRLLLAEAWDGGAGRATGTLSG